MFPVMNFYMLFYKNVVLFLIFKPTLEYRRNGKIQVKGNVDAELVLHSMIQYKDYDKAIIVSGTEISIV